MLPVVGRELLVAARRPSSYLARSGFVALLVLLVTLVGWNSGLFQVSAKAGMAVFGVSAGLLFLYSLASGVMLTADCLSSERREGTLPLLFLTDLNAGQVVLGKMLCSSVHGFYFFLSVLPALSIGFLFGGIEWPLVFMTLAVLLSTLIVSLELGVFVSSISLVERKALMATLLAIISWVLGPLLVEQLTTGRFFLDVLADPHFFTVGFLSPLTQVLAASQSTVSVTAKILAGVAGSQVIGFLLLRRSSRSLANGKTGDEQQGSPGSRKQLSRSTRQQVYRSRLLDRSPTRWLTARQPWKREAALLFTLTVLTLDAILLFLPFETDQRLTILVGGIWFVCCFYKVWTLFETCQRSFEDRQTGALELLLTTSLSVREMAAGFHRALQGWFLPSLPLPCAVFITMCLLFARALPEEGVNETVLTLLAIAIVTAADLWALAWVGLWQAVRSRSTLRACVRTLFILYSPTLFLVLVLTALQNVTYPLIPQGVSMRLFVLGVYTAVGLLSSLLAGFYARKFYLKGLRRVAAARFESSSRSKRISIRSCCRDLPGLIIRSPISLVGWMRLHPVWATVGLLIVFFLALHALRIRNLDHQVARRVQEIAANGWPTNYSVFHETRGHARAKNWIDANKSLREFASSYKEFQTSDFISRGFAPYSPPSPFSPPTTNQIAFIRPHLTRNSQYFELAGALALADWIDASQVEGVRRPQVFYVIRSLSPRRIDFPMLAWKGVFAVEDHNLDEAALRVEQLLRIGRIGQRTHRYFGLNWASTACLHAADLTERIVSRASPSADMLRRLRAAWTIPDEDIDLRPELHQAFAELATGWDRLISSRAADLADQPGIGRISLPLIASAERLTGRHQRDALATLEAYTNVARWNGLLLAKQPIYVGRDGPDSVILGSMDSRHDELARIVNATRDIQTQARVVRVGLALREQQLEHPGAGRAQWMHAATNQASLNTFAPGFSYIWETNGFTVSMGKSSASSGQRGGSIHYQVLRKDWIQPAP